MRAPAMSTWLPATAWARWRALGGLSRRGPRAHRNATRPQQQPRCAAAPWLIFPRRPALQMPVPNACGHHGVHALMMFSCAYPSAVHSLSSGGTIWARDGCGTQLPLAYAGLRTLTNCVWVRCGPDDELLDIGPCTDHLVQLLCRALHAAALRHHAAAETSTSMSCRSNARL